MIYTSTTISAWDVEAECVVDESTGDPSRGLSGVVTLTQKVGSSVYISKLSERWNFHTSMI